MADENGDLHPIDEAFPIKVARVRDEFVGKLKRLPGFEGQEWTKDKIVDRFKDIFFDPHYDKGVKQQFYSDIAATNEDYSGWSPQEVEQDVKTLFGPTKAIEQWAALAEENGKPLTSVPPLPFIADNRGGAEAISTGTSELADSLPQTDMKARVEAQRQRYKELLDIRQAIDSNPVYRETANKATQIASEISSSKRRKDFDELRALADEANANSKANNQFEHSRQKTAQGELVTSAPLPLDKWKRYQQLVNDKEIQSLIEKADSIATITNQPEFKNAGDKLAQINKEMEGVPQFIREAEDKVREGQDVKEFALKLKAQIQQQRAKLPQEETARDFDPMTGATTLPSVSPERSALIKAEEHLDDVIAIADNPRESIGRAWQALREFARAENSVPFVAEAVRALNTTRIAQILSKPEKDRTEVEKILVDSRDALQMIQSNPQYQSWIQDIVGGSLNMLPYIAEYGATSKIVTRVAEMVETGIAKKMGEAGMKNWIRAMAGKELVDDGTRLARILGKTPRPIILGLNKAVRGATTAIGVAAQTAANPQFFAQDFAQRQVPQYNIVGKTPDGERLVRELDSTGNFDTAFQKVMKSLGQGYIELLTERWGSFVEKPLEFAKRYFLGGWLKKHAFDSGLAQTLKRLGWNGILGEQFEEEANALLGNLIEGQGFKPMDMHQRLVTLGSIALVGAAPVAARAIRYKEINAMHDAIANENRDKWNQQINDLRVWDAYTANVVKNIKDVGADKTWAMIDLVGREIQATQDMLRNPQELNAEQIQHLQSILSEYETTFTHLDRAWQIYKEKNKTEAAKIESEVDYTLLREPKQIPIKTFGRPQPGQTTIGAQPQRVRVKAGPTPKEQFALPPISNIAGLVGPHVWQVTPEGQAIPLEPMVRTAGGGFAPAQRAGEVEAKEEKARAEAAKAKVGEQALPKRMRLAAEDASSRIRSGQEREAAIADAAKAADLSPAEVQSGFALIKEPAAEHKNVDVLIQEKEKADEFGSLAPEVRTAEATKQVLADIFRGYNYIEEAEDNLKNKPNLSFTTINGVKVNAETFQQALTLAKEKPELTPFSKKPSTGGPKAPQKPKVEPKAPQVELTPEKRKDFINTLLELKDRINATGMWRGEKKSWKGRAKQIKDAQLKASQHGLELSIDKGTGKATLYDISGDERKELRFQRETTMDKPVEGEEARLLSDIPPETLDKMRTLIEQLGSDLHIGDLSKAQIEAAIKDIETDDGKEASARAQEVIKTLEDAVLSGYVDIRHGQKKGEWVVEAIPVDEVEKRKEENDERAGIEGESQSPMGAEPVVDEELLRAFDELKKLMGEEEKPPEGGADVQSPTGPAYLDEVNYSRMKAAFGIVLKSVRDKNGTADDFIKAVVKQLGEGARIYAEAYADDIAAELSYQGGQESFRRTGESGTFRRPRIRVIDARDLPRPPAYISNDKYAIDAHQRFAVNLILARFQRKGTAFLLGDGTGVGKTRSILVVAKEMMDRNNKPALIVVPNKTIIETRYAEDAKAIGINPKSIEIITYHALREQKGGQGDYAVVIFDEAHNLKNLQSRQAFEATKVRADNRVYATATPMDGAHNAAYFLSQISGVSEEEVQHRLGYTIDWYRDPQTGEDRPFPRLLDTVKTWAEVFDNIIRLRNEAIAAGGMIRREYPFYGTVGSLSLQLSQNRQGEQTQIDRFWQRKIDSVPPFKRRLRMNYAGQRIGELSRWLEPLKAAFLIERVMADVKEGRSVIIAAEGIEPTQIKGLGYQEITALISRVEDGLKTEGIEFVRIYGGKNKSEAVRKFQNNEVKVVIMTTKSGGAGIDLDDNTGKSPRTLYLATPNFGADVIDQVFGRVSRRNTMTPATVWMVVANGAISDDRRMQIVARKLGVLTRIQSGEDPDVAAFRESVEERRQQGITEGTKEPYIIQQNDQPAGKNEQVVLDRIIAIKERIAQVEGEMQGDMFGGETGGKLEAERKALVSELQTLNKTGIFEARQKDEAVRKSQGKQQSLFPDYGTLFDIHQENIPEFKSTNEAIAFGATASRQQILALQTRLAQTREEAKGKTGQEALNYGFKTQFDREAIQEAQKRTNIVAQVTPNANIQDRAERQRDYQANVDIVRKIQLGFDLTGFQQSRTPQVNLLGSSIARDLSIRGSAEIIGQRINTTNDFAAIMQIYRNPGFEISHYVFVKDGKVVGHTMFTFRIPTASTIIPPNVDRDSLSNWLNEQMTRYGADGFYFVHNHPGGNPTPSQADVDASLSIGKSHARFLGHVIIDSNRYAFLKSYAGGIKSEVIDAKFLKDPDAIYRASVPHPILGAVALTQDHLARIASQVNNRENNLVLIGRKLGVVSGVGLLSKDILKPSQIKKLGEILREFAVSTGSMDVALTNIPADANNETLQKIVDLMLGGYLIESMDETGVSLTNVIKLAGGSESSVPKHSRFGISSRDATLLESPQVMREGEGTLLKIGQNVVRAFRGNSRYVPLDGLAGTISFAAYRGIGAIKGLVRYLGIPSYVGNRVPALREAFYALREGMFEGNERYQAVAEMITKIKEELNPTDEEGQNVATALYRGNDKDQQRYYTEAELRSRFNMTDREVLIYSAMVAAQKEATAIKIDAVKFYMMQHDLDLKDVAEINPSDPEFSSLSREQLEALTEIVTDLRAHRFAFSSPRIERIWEDIQPLVKQVVVDRKATEMVRRLGGYLSLQRTGEWYVRWRDAEGKLNWNQYQLQQEAAKAAKFYKDQGFTEVDSGRTREINFASSYVDQLSLAELMDLIEQLGIEKNKQVQKLVDEFKRMGFAAHMITRKYVPGYERTFDNAIRSIHDYARGAGSNLARTKGKILALRSLDNINGSENPGEYKLVKDYIDGYFGMRGEEGSLLRKAVYTSALSWSPTFVIQQIFQPYVTHLPNIGAEVGALRAPKILEQANAMTVSHMLHLPKALSLPAELRAFLQRAGMRESIAGSMIEEFAGHVQMSGRAMAPRTTEAFVSLGVKKETMQNILAKAETIIEFAGAVTERKNRIQGFIAGYLIGKDKGLTGEALFKYAERFTEYVNIPYGKQNLPIAIMHAGHFRGLARLFYTFISFQSAIYHMAGQAIRGKLPLSKKAAAVAYGTLSWVGLAGVQGIPLYWLFKFIWKSLIGGDPEDELRKVSEDLPTAAKEILDSGIMSQVGVDLRRSLGAGEAAPFTSFYPIRAVQQAASAYDYFERGEVKKGIARLPIGVPPLARGAMRSLEAQQGGISYGARTLVPADKLTTRQKLLLAFNLTPMEVGKSYDVERRLSDEQKARAFQFDVFADKYARALIAQDTAGRTAIIEQIKKYNEQVREKYPSLMVEGKSFRMAVERRVRELKLGIDKTDSRRGGLLRRTLKERVTP